MRSRHSSSLLERTWSVVRTFAIGAGFTAVFFAVAPTLAADPDANALSPEDRFARDQATCIARVNGQDPAACLREARAAYDLSRRGALAEYRDADVLTRNRYRRCDPLPEPDRRDCIARVDGAGDASGSVEQGGIYRELRTTQPAQPSAEPPPVR